ncbi:MAG TPA: MgtC/SapB family protein [Candidatus Sulfotelmatobacter sp.]|jgi:putative Mg2+ transporter-C (MgtC) family protein|nr:MgtC/SapB family protein [Candidatus Sulfotelmatobacter sp.]
MHLLRGEGGVRIVSYIVSGIGFLGAGVIMKDGAHVCGLNTAATLWCSAAVGACAGAGVAAEAILLTAFVLAGNTLLRPQVNYINCKPMDERVTEACYRVHVVCDPAVAADVRERLYAELEKANYPLREIEVLSEGDDEVELATVLVPTTASSEKLGAVVQALETQSEIASCAWTVSTVL